MGIRLITPPAVEPVTVSEMKAMLRVDFTDDDTVIAAYITSAREFIERRVQSKLPSQTWEFLIDEFPEYEIRLPFGPVQSISSIKYDDGEGLEQTVPAEDYQLDNTSPEPWVFTAVGWPTDVLDAFNAVRIRFVAGYSSSALIPGSLRAAVILKTKELYDGENNTPAINDLITNHYTMAV